MRPFLAILISGLALAACSKPAQEDPFAGGASSDGTGGGAFKPSPPGRYHWEAPKQVGNAASPADHVHDTRPEAPRTYQQ